MAGFGNSDEDGTQIKVWVPGALYDLLRARAGRNHTSVAAEARRLMRAGVSAVEGIDALHRDLASVTRWLELHMEPLVFLAAMDAARSELHWEAQIRATNPKAAEDLERRISALAADRISRKLQAIEDPDGHVEADDDEP